MRLDEVDKLRFFDTAHHYTFYQGLIQRPKIEFLTYTLANLAFMTKRKHAILYQAKLLKTALLSLISYLSIFIDHRQH